MMRNSAGVRALAQTRRAWKAVAAMKQSALFEAILVDGSFVTDKLAPNDVDILAVLCFVGDLDSTLWLWKEAAWCMRLTSNSSVEYGKCLS